MNDPILDVAIVGGGVAGLYAGWRLRAEGNASSPATSRREVAIFEASGRVGGRMATKFFADMPNVPVELGAEGYFQADLHFDPHQSDPLHKWPGDYMVDCLVQHLGLKASPIRQGNDNNLLFLRGKHFSVGELRDPHTVDYDLTWKEGHEIADLLGYAFDRIIEGGGPYERTARNRTGQDWAKSRGKDAWKGKPLHQHNLQDLLSEVLSPGALAFLNDTQSDPTVFTKWNAEDAMPQLLATLYGDLPTYTLDDGFDALPKALARRFQEAGGTLELGTMLASLRVLPQEGATPLIELELRAAGGSTRKVLARNVILAVTRRPLEQLCVPELIEVVGEELHADIAAVNPIRAGKIYLVYPSPFWRRLATAGGFTTTDTPLKSLFYFQTQGEMPGAPDPDCHHSLLLASLRTFDAESVHSAETLPLPDGVEHALHPHAGAMIAAPHGTDKPGSYRPIDKVALERIKADVDRVHGLTDGPQPVAGLEVYWDDCNPYGAGWYYWKPGVKSWEIQERMRKPRAGVPLYVVGSAYSNEQGWVNGALQSVEATLEASFALPRPGWLPFRWYGS